jgi:hypothetical protein
MKGKNSMKRTVIAVSFILASGIILSGTACAADQPAGPPPAQGACMTAQPMHRPAPAPGMMLLMNYIQANVLAELTGLPQENVRMMLVCAPVPAILDQYGIDPGDFFAAMDKQMGRLVSQAAAGNVITKKQAEDIRKKMTGRTMHKEE